MKSLKKYTAILIYWTDFPSVGEPVKWVPLDLSSDGAHLTGSPPKGESVQYIRHSKIYNLDSLMNSIKKYTFKL